MINIKVTLPESLLAFARDESPLVESVRNILVERYMEIYNSKIDDELNTTKSQYRDAVSVDFIGNNQAEISLSDEKWLPIAIEEGASAFDMKENLLKGDDGSGVNIKFNFGTSTNDGSPRPSFYKKNTMPKAVEKLASSLSKGQRLSSSVVPDKKINPSNAMDSIYSGMYKNKDNTGKTSQHNTFRKVSKNSSPDSWQHPGIEKHNIMGKSINDFLVEKDDIVNNFLSGYLS